MKKIIFIFILIITLTNCTVTKRIHRSGWHVELKRNYKNSFPKESIEKISNLEFVDQIDTSQNDEFDLNYENVVAELIETELLAENSKDKIEEVKIIKPIPVDTIYVYEEDLEQNQHWIPKPLKKEKLKPGTGFFQVVAWFFMFPTFIGASYFAFLIIELGFSSFIVLESCLVASPLLFLAAIVCVSLFTFTKNTYSSIKIKRRARRRKTALLFLIFFSLFTLSILLMTF